MNTRNGKDLLLTLLLIAGGFGAVFALSGRLEAARPPMPEGFEDQDLALQGARVRGFALGMEGLAADWYWMQSLQYIGNKILKNPGIKVSLDNLTPLNPRLLYPYLDNATTLDPKFNAPYHYGAVVLPAIDPKQAVLIAEKGIANNPGDFRLYQHLGFIYWKLGDYEKAAEVYDRASKVEGAPAFLKMMVAQMRTEGGSRGTARAIYQEMYDSAENTQTRELAELRLKELDSFEDRDEIRAALNRFRERNGRCVANWAELLPSLVGVKLPRGRQFLIDRNNQLLDPTLVPYYLDREKCDVSVDLAKSKIPT